MSPTTSHKETNEKIEEEIIQGCGLSPEQAKIYYFLLKFGKTEAKEIALKTGIGRVLTYKVLGQLAKLDLALERKDKGKIALFGATHPSKLRDMAASRKIKSQRALDALDAIMDEFGSVFHKHSGRPSIHFFEGDEGAQKFIKDIIRENQSVSVFRKSPQNFEEDPPNFFMELEKKLRVYKIGIEIVDSAHFGKKDNFAIIFYASKVAMVTWSSHVSILIIEDNNFSKILFSFARANHKPTIATTMSQPQVSP